MIFKTKLAFITWVYWFLLLYMVAALVWWFIALNQQAGEMADLRVSIAKVTDPDYKEELRFAEDFKNRKRAQYIGEGVTFLVLICVGAVFVYRATRKQIQLGQQQSNFMMAVTHELKTPIAAARLNIETLQKHRLEEDKQKQLLKGALIETDRLNDLTNNILLTSRMESGESFHFSDQIDLFIIVADVCRQFEIRYPAIEWKRSLQPVGILIGDELLIRILLSNLMDNAIKYGSTGKKIECMLELSGNKALLSVNDLGPGIADIEKKKVFDKFYRVGNENTRLAKGTGLGLYLCKRIVTAHGGSVSVEDNQPHGTIFKIILPVKTS